MPYILPHTDTVVVPVHVLVPDFWPTWGALEKKLTRDKKKKVGIKRARFGGGKNNTVLIDYDTLPPYIQKELADPRVDDHLLERFYQRDQSAVAFYSDFRYPDGARLLPDALERYVTNASVMNALILLHNERMIERKNKNKSTRGLLGILAHDADTFNETLRKKYNTEHNIPTSKRFNAAFKDFKKHSYISLIKDIKGKSRLNALKVTEDVQALLNSLFAEQSHKPSPTEIAAQYEAFLDGSFEIINNSTGEIYNPADYPELSESSVRAFLTSWESTIGTHAKRNGNRQQLMQKFTPYHSFEKPTFAGSIISVDDRQPPFEYEPGKRMWFYNAIDLASGAFVAWVYGKSKEGIILEFYRQLVRNYHDWGFNLPAEIEGEISLNVNYQDSFLKEGNMFEFVRLHANSARSKRIEAYYKPLRYQFEKQRPGWLARPFALSEPNQISNVKKEIIPYKELTQQCLYDLQLWNNTSHHTHKNMSKWDYFVQNQNPNLRPTNYNMILPLLGHHEQSSCNAGIVRFRRRLWLLGDQSEIQTGEALIQLMKTVEGKSFDIYWLDGNQGEVIKAFIYQDGRQICELIQKPMPNKATIERTSEDAAAMDIMARYTATVNGYMRLQKNSIEKITVNDNRLKTVNNNFQIPGLGSFTMPDRPLVIEDDEMEEEYAYDQNDDVSTPSWNRNFNID